MIVVEAPKDIALTDKDIVCFLAGGITDCEDWQREVIKYLRLMDTEHLVVFNPRRENFDVTDKSASDYQIAWEFKYLSKMDIFSMYFAKSKSVQPICFYELGRNLVTMQDRFPKDYRDRIIVSTESGFLREKDAKVQTMLALGTDKVITNSNPKEHASYIYEVYAQLNKERN